jgi:hypothetical protein
MKYVFVVLFYALAMLGEVISGYTTNIGIRTYFFDDPFASWALTAFINGSIVASAAALKASISGQAFQRSPRVFFLSILIVTFAASCWLSSVGAYKHFGFKENQTGVVVQQGREDFVENSEAHEVMRQADMKNVRAKIEELNKVKQRQEAIAKNSKNSGKTRNMASIEADKAKTQINVLNSTVTNLERISFPAFQQGVNLTSEETINELNRQKQAFETARQTLINLHQSLPEELQRKNPAPGVANTAIPPTNEQSAFLVDLRDRKPPAVSAFSFGFVLDLICFLWAFAGVEFPRLAVRITRVKVWFRSVWSAIFSTRLSTVLFFLPNHGVRFALDLKTAAAELLVEDLEDHAEEIERLIAQRLGRQAQDVTIAGFLTADGEPISRGESLLAQLPQDNQTITIILEEDELGANTNTYADREMGLGV